MDKNLKAAVAGLVTALTITGAAASPAQAAKPDPKQVVVNSDTYSALGDSYAAGVGSGVPINASGQTLEAYPVLLAGKVNKVNFLAESGATTSDVLADQITQIPATTQQVTLTVGGNDLDFVESATACLSIPSTCAGVVTTISTALPQLTTDVAVAINAIQAQAPDAHVYVTGYPLLFQAEQTLDNSGVCVVGWWTGSEPLAPLPVWEAQTDAIDLATMGLNGAINTATTIADPTHEDVTYVDVTDEFAGHGLCGTLVSGQPNPATYIDPIYATMTPAGPVVDISNAPLHPTAEGQQAYAAAVLAEGFENRTLAEG